LFNVSSLAHLLGIISIVILKLNQDEFGLNCAVNKHTKILVKYGENLCFGRYSKGQILADDIGRSLV